ncbi:MAG: arginase family protein [Bacteroidota bacterium]
MSRDYKESRRTQKEKKEIINLEQMNLNDYFDPVTLERPDEKKMLNPHLFCKNIAVHTPDNSITDIQQFDLAIIGIKEGRNSYHEDCGNAPDKVREKLYELIKSPGNTRIIDLGNLKIPHTLSDTHYGMKDVLVFLLNQGVIPILIGGGKNLSFGAYLAQESLLEKVNIVNIDSELPFQYNHDPDFKYFLDSILERKHNLFQFTSLGYQSCLVNQENIKNLEKLDFTTTRIGMVRANFNEIEPEIRDADIINLSLSSVKQTDAPGQIYPSPNGFYSEEACQIARYAGLSNKKAIFGIYDIYPKNDVNNQTAHLGAQIIWYFIEGYYYRKRENLQDLNKEFKKFIVNLNEKGHDLIFYKNLKSLRWWLEIPSIEKKEKIVIACSENDYKKACSHEIPGRWLKIFQKIN